MKKIIWRDREVEEQSRKWGAIAEEEKYMYEEDVKKIEK